MSDESNKAFLEAMIARRFTEAAEIAQRQLSQLENTSGISTPEYCVALHDAAMAIQVLGDHAAAAMKLEQAVTTLKHLAPSTEDNQRILARCLTRLGEIYLRHKQTGDAESVLSEVLVLLRSMPSRSNSDTTIEARVYLGMANLCAQRKDWGAASQRLLESIRYSRPRQSGDPGLCCEGLMKLGRIYAHLGRLADADKLIRRAIYWHLDASSRESLYYAWLISILGGVLLKRGDHTGAAAFREEALDIVHKLRPEDDALVSRVEAYFRIEPESTVVADHAGE